MEQKQNNSDNVFSLLIITVKDLHNDIWVGVKFSPVGNLKYPHLKLGTIYTIIFIISHLCF